MIYRETRLERWPVPSCNGMTIEQVAEGVKESALGYYGERDDLVVERVALLEDHVCDDNCEEQGREYDGVPPCEGMGWRDLGVTVIVETKVYDQMPVIIRRCWRCEHEWAARKPDPPVKCPRCQAPFRDE